MEGDKSYGGASHFEELLIYLDDAALDYSCFKHVLRSNINEDAFAPLSLGTYVCGFSAFVHDHVCLVCTASHKTIQHLAITATIRRSVMNYHKSQC
jgi:hypothetical protein